MNAMVTLTAMPFLGMMIDSLKRSCECWDLKGCKGMGDCRVSSDDHVNQWHLADFRDKGRLACALGSTHCHKDLRVAMHSYGGE